MRAVRPGGRVPLAGTSRRPAQAHRGGGPAPAHRGGTRPSHERAGPAGTALLWIHVHLRDPTSVAHLSHLFVP